MYKTGVLVSVTLGLILLIYRVLLTLSADTLITRVVDDRKVNVAKA